MELLHGNPRFQRKLNFRSSDEEDESVLFFAPMLNGTPGQDALLAPSLWPELGANGDGNTLNEAEQAGAFPPESGQGVLTRDYFYPYDTFYPDVNAVKEEEEANAFLTSSMMDDCAQQDSDMSWFFSSEDDHKSRPRAAGHYHTTESDRSTEPVRSERTTVDAVMSKSRWHTTAPWRGEHAEAQRMTAAPSLRCRSARQNRISTARRGKASSTSPQSAGRRGKGVTMLYRTMARKLLAGSGWIMHSSISKESAKELIRILIGETLYRALQIDGELTEAERVSVDKKEHHCNRLFADILTFYIGHVVSLKEADSYVRHDKGPYRLADEFLYLLKEKPWPPHLPSEADLRAFGCYREGETPGPRAQVSSNEHAFDFIRTREIPRN